MDPGLLAAIGAAPVQDAPYRVCPPPRSPGIAPAGVWEKLRAALSSPDIH